MPPRPSESEYRRLIAAYQSQVTRVRSRVVSFIEASWGGLGSWRDGDVEKFVAQVLPVVAGGQRQVASLTDAYLAREAQMFLGGRLSLSGAPAALVVGAVVRNGTPPEVVYGRAGKETWRNLAAGVALDVAVERGGARAAKAAEMDLQLAKTHAARYSNGRDGRVVGFRRTLSGVENCAMCFVASSQRYHREALLPIHPGCDCGVSRIYGDADPGQVIDEGILNATHEAMEARFGASDAGARAPDYRKAIIVREHGEFGPILTVKSHRFTGPDDI